MQEKENVLRILNETLVALKKEDTIKLKELSDQTVHTASISQDPDNIAVAVIVYSLSKIIERPGYRNQTGWNKLYNGLLVNIENSIVALKKGDDTHLAAHLEKVRKQIEGISSSLKRYIQDVFIKASINKASRIYEHGISMEKTAKLLGISQWELASYAAQKQMKDHDLSKTMTVKNRIKLAEEFFK